MEYQDAISIRNETLPKDDQLIFRIGINMGDVIEEGGNLLGEGVNIAARLEAFAQSGGVCISQSIYDLVEKRTNFSFIDLGQQKVKNTVLRAIDLEIPSAQPRSAKISSPASRKKRIIFSTLAITCIVILGGLASFLFQEQQSFKGTESLVTIDRFISLMKMERYAEAKQVAEDLARQKGIRKTAKAEAINLIALTYYSQNQSAQASEIFSQQKELDSRVSISSLRALWVSNSNRKEVDSMLENLKKLGLN